MCMYHHKTNGSAQRTVWKLGYVASPPSLNLSPVILVVILLFEGVLLVRAVVADSETWLVNRNRLIGPPSYSGPHTMLLNRERINRDVTAGLTVDSFSASGTEWQDIVGFVMSIEAISDRLCLDDDLMVLDPVDIGLQESTLELFDNEKEATENMANTLNILMPNIIDIDVPTSSAYDNLFYSIVQNNVKFNANAYASCIVFSDTQSTQTLSSYYAYRGDDGVIALKNLSLPATSYEWYTIQIDKFNQYNLTVSATNVSSYGDSVSTYVYTDIDVGEWTLPYYYCEGGGQWVMTYSTPFFDVDTSGRASLRGVVATDVSLNSIDINQCSDGSTAAFANTHKCKNDSTTCEAVSGRGFQLGSYHCVCNLGFYFPYENSTPSYFNGSVIETEYQKMLQNSQSYYPDGFQCAACSEGCGECVDDSPCFITNHFYIRTLLLSIEVLCTCIALIAAVIVFRNRHIKVIKSTGWQMHLVLLTGISILYTAEIIRYFEPHSMICILQVWFREMGIVLTYGVLILKLFRILTIFHARSASRVRLCDKDLLKWLGLVIIILSGYLASWTAVHMEKIDKGDDLIQTGIDSLTKLKYWTCSSNWWDLFIESVEVIFLLWGVYLCYRTRKAPSHYSEGRHISWAIYNETLVTILFHIIRHVLWLSVAPDWMYMLYVIHSQLTTTVTLAIVFLPKYIINKQVKMDKYKRKQSDVFDLVECTDSFKLDQNNFTNSNCFNPEDVRAELRRLYTQLEIYRNKTMLKDNPHIKKKKERLGGWNRTARRLSRRFTSMRGQSHHSSGHSASDEESRPESRIAEECESHISYHNSQPSLTQDASPKSTDHLEDSLS